MTRAPRSIEVLRPLLTALDDHSLPARPAVRAAIVTAILALVLGLCAATADAGAMSATAAESSDSRDAGGDAGDGEDNGAAGSTLHRKRAGGAGGGKPPAATSQADADHGMAAIAPRPVARALPSSALAVLSADAGRVGRTRVFLRAIRPRPPTLVG